MILVTRILPDIILASTALTVAALCLIYLRKSQDELLPHYHDFADHRAIWGIPNFFDFTSNALFLLFGLMGVCAMFIWRKNGSFFEDASEFWNYVFFFCAIIGTGMPFFNSRFISLGIGSGYYHWHPDTGRLFWDRIFIALAMMSFFGALLNERVLPHLSPLSKSLIVTTLVLIGGLGTTLWHITEEQGHGNISYYAVVIWTITALFPLVLLMYPTRYRGTRYVFGAIMGFVFSRAFETFDRQIFAVFPISGHTLKHVAASLAVLFILLYVKCRRVINPTYFWKL